MTSPDRTDGIALDPAECAPPTQPGLLLVDDDPFMLAMQSRMLKTMGYQRVDAAGSGEAALQLIHQAPQAFDVVVCDVNMPGMDGIEFLQYLDASAFRGNVILLSGEGIRIMHAVQKLLDSGRLVILGSLEKPTRRAHIRALLDAWRPPTAGATAAGRVFTGEDLQTAQRELQWVLHYQPKVDMKTGVLNGMEALVRWNHPVDGLLYPESFIGPAETTGAIDAMAEWVLQDAFRQLAQWQATGLKLKLAVNLSMENLKHAGFSQRVGDLARAAGVSPLDVVLEITESRLIPVTRAPLESLVRLRLQRFGLSIDDFGSGHSSLAQLRDVPFSELKVDRGFVLGARYNQIIRPILEGSIGIAKRMGMQSVAEGVETEDDWHLLRSIGCDYAQGTFIGRPMPADDLPEWQAIWQTRRLRLAGS